MKQTTAIIFFLMLLCTAGAQETRLNAYGAYVFDDKIDSYWDNNAGYYTGRIEGISMGGRY